MTTMARLIFSGKLKKVEFMELEILWVAKYTSTAKFVKKFGFSLTLTRQFKSENEAIEFMNQVKRDDTNNDTYRNIVIYHY